MVEHKRVQQAERLLLDSARDTYLLKHRGDGTYLTISDSPLGPLDEPGLPMDAEPGTLGETFSQPPVQEGAFRQPQPRPDSLPPANTITFSLDEIGQLREDEFETVCKPSVYWSRLVEPAATRPRNLMPKRVSEAYLPI